MLLRSNVKLERVYLGSTDIKVSRLCFGSLTMTPFQANLSVKEGANLIKYAYSKGINFIDTAEIYNNYHYIKEGLKDIKRDDYVIASKTYAYTEKMAEDSLEKALHEIGTDYIDVFLLHEQESIHTIRGHFPAIEYLKRAKKEGKVRAIGISTHRVDGVKGFLETKDLDVIHPIINKTGLGIHDGSIEDMLYQVKLAYDMGRGIYGMKPLGGGHLIQSIEEAFDFVRKIPYIHSIAIGMQSYDEVDADVSLMENGYIREELKKSLRNINRRLIVHDYCQGCGNCVKRCQQGGITLVDGQATPNDNCILCGYCATVCPEFCIKVI